MARIRHALTAGSTEPRIDGVSSALAAGVWDFICLFASLLARLSPLAVNIRYFSNLANGGSLRIF